jgi:Zn-dependent M28 family amino/carboxypeptidase
MNQEKCQTLHLFFSLEKVKANNIQIETMIRKILPIVMVCAAFVGCKQAPKQVPTTYEPVAPKFSVDSAFSYVAKQCEFGPRVMNSAAHDSCGAWIAQKFESFGGKVICQTADLKLYDGTPIKSTNIIASFNVENPERIMICSHWDSRPWADQDDDESKHKTPIDGANDGASGVGVLLELARLIQQQAPSIGVDLICWDAEDCGTPSWEENREESDRTWCLGSQYWAQHHHVDGYRARYGILLDMVGGPKTVFKKELFSERNAPRLVDKVWGFAHSLGYGEFFKFEDGGYVTDDHLPVMQSGIPCIDVIGSSVNGGSFCHTWHTMLDNLQNIDKNTLNAVGTTVAEVVWCEK